MITGSVMTAISVRPACAERTSWAQEMGEVTKQWCAQEVRHLPDAVRDGLLAQYFSILAIGMTRLLESTEIFPKLTFHLQCLLAPMKIVGCLSVVPSAQTEGTTFDEL